MWEKTGIIIIYLPSSNYGILKSIIWIPRSLLVQTYFIHLKRFFQVFIFTNNYSLLDLSLDFNIQQMNHWKVNLLKSKNSPEFVLDKDHNIWAVIKKLFAARGHQSLLWVKIITFEQSSRNYSRAEATRVCCG